MKLLPLLLLLLSCCCLCKAQHDQASEFLFTHMSLLNRSYPPTFSVQTKNGKVRIIVADNCNGIPQNILDKILRPFLTTKPTGTGTGLGLSLAYDIIKAHGGEIKAEGREGEGSEFIIQLPYNP